MAAQLTARKRPLPASPGALAWMARATSSLPVPLSPVMSTVERVGATLRTSSKTCCMAATAADDVAGLMVAVQFAPQPLVFQVQLAIGQQPPHLAGHLVEQDRLHQVVVGAALERLDGVLDRGVGGDEQHEGLGADLQQSFQHLQTVDARQLHVAQDHVIGPLFRLGERFLTAGAGRDGETFAGQILGQGVADQRLVIDDEKATCGSDGAGTGGRTRVRI